MKKALLTLYVLIVTATTNVFHAQVWAKQIGGTLSDKGNVIKTDASGNVYTIGTFSGTCDFDPSAATFTITSSGATDIFISKLNSSGGFLWAKKIGGSGSDNVGDMNFDATGNIYLTGDFNNTCDFDPGPSTNTITPFGAVDIYVCKLDQNGNFIWAKQMGGAWFDRGGSIAVDAAGDVIIAGDFSTSSSGLTADFDPGPGTFTFTTGSGGGNTDIFITKLTSAGIFVWAKQIGGTNGDFGNSVKTDNANNIYLGGYFTGTTDFDPNAGVTNLVSLGFEDIYVLKLNSSGNFIWARNMGSNTVDICTAISLDASGNVYSTGYFRGTADFDPGAGTYTLSAVAGDDIFISKLDAAGSFIWARSMGSTSSDQGLGITTDAAGNIYTTGVFRLTVDFDPGAGSYSLTTFGNGDVFIHKLNSTGIFQWAGQMGGATDDFGYGLTTDASGNIFATGYFNATGDFDPNSGSLNMTSSGQTDAFIVKTCQTPSQPGSISGAYSVCAGTSTNYSVSPVASATLYTWALPSGWSGSSSTNTLNAIPGSSGIFSVSATNGCGVGPIQTQSINVNPQPTVNASSSASLICSGQSATLVASGANTYSWNTTAATQIIVVSPITSTNYSVTGTDINGCQNTVALTVSVSACTGISTLNSESGVCVYPNPANTDLHIKLKETLIGSELKIKTILGELIYVTKVEEREIKLDLNNIPSGIYFISLEKENSIMTRKFIKE